MDTMNLQVRGINFGAGKPKICVPIVGKTYEEIVGQAKEIAKEKPDCIELRIDWYEHVFDKKSVCNLLKDIRKAIGNVVLLFTFRSAKEGGEKNITVSQYTDLCTWACESGFIDLLDVEAYMQVGLLNKLTEMAHKNQVYVIGSNHDFDKTPSEEELKNRLRHIDGMGADIPKLAVMPVKERDVLNLLSATLAYHENGGKKPIITMSMKGMGGISRLAGGLVGSAMTFATVGNASAPGQIPIKQVQSILEVF